MAAWLCRLALLPPRWHIEDDTYRELKEGWGLEKQHWGRDLAAAPGRVTLTCLAFNTAQVYRLQAGLLLAAVAIRRLRRRRERALGNAPAVIYLAGCYGVFALEELLVFELLLARVSCLLCTSPSLQMLHLSLISKYLTLVEQALQMALARRHPERGLLHHSDRGSTYTSNPI